jgi:hypothetical protein
MPHRRSISLAAVIIALTALRAGAFPQAAPQSPDPVAAVRQMAADARKEITAYEASADRQTEHPGTRWVDALWQIHQHSPGADAGALAAVEAIRILTQARRWDDVEARAAALPPDDGAWKRLPAVLYEAAIARNDLPSVISRLSQLAESTTEHSIKASALIVVGRAYRRLGDRPAAERSLQRARDAAPGTPSAEQADGLLYEVTHLSPGMPAPPISGRARSGRPVSLAALRGKPVVLVFWGTT